MQILPQALAFLLGILVPHWVIRFDERTLPRESYERGWNDASHWAAVVGFSFLCLPVHFYRTRRRLRGLLLGLVWMFGAASAVGALVEGTDFMLR